MGNQTTKSPFDVQILAARLKDLMRESVPKVSRRKTLQRRSAPRLTWYRRICTARAVRRCRWR